MAEQCAEQPKPTTTEVGPGGVPKGAKTSDFYRVYNIPDRFDNPGHCYNPGNPVFTCDESFPSDSNTQNAEWFEGYESKQSHPMYRTSAQEYGNRPPTVHTMPTTFHCKSQKFSNHLGQCGMPRNHSLNTGVDPTMF